MARTSRQDRRQRRGIAAGVPPLRPPVRPVAVGGDEPQPKSSEPSVERSSDGSRGFPGLRFVRESIAELKKVEWPTQQQVVSGTAVVLVACIIVGIYLYANDKVWSYLVEHVLLK